MWLTHAAHIHIHAERGQNLKLLIAMSLTLANGRLCLFKENPMISWCCFSITPGTKPSHPDSEAISLPRPHVPPGRFGVFLAGFLCTTEEREYLVNVCEHSSYISLQGLRNPVCRQFHCVSYRFPLVSSWLNREKQTKPLVIFNLGKFS